MGRILTGSGVLLAVGLLAHQEPSEPETSFRAGVHVVRVDVTVLDKDRRPVRDLTAADFTILEDGKARPIVSFAGVDLVSAAARRPAQAAAWVTTVARDTATNAVADTGRLIVVMLDWSIRFEDQQIARRIATAAVDSLAPGDLAAIVFTNPAATAGTSQDFTADRGRLLKAINQPFAPAEHNPPSGPDWDSRRNKNGVMIEDPEGYESGDCQCRLCVLDAVTRVADSMRNVPGRQKSLLWVGTYFQGYEPNLPGAAANFSGALGSRGSCGSALREARDKMARALARANVTAHVLDATGLANQATSPLGNVIDELRVRQPGLPMLADLTGGRTVMNTNTPEAAVPAILDESGFYYLLGFIPADPSSKTRVHSIKVTLPRHDVTVHARSGYALNEFEAAQAVAGREAPGLATLLHGVLPVSDLPLSLAAAPFAGRDATATLVLAIGVGPLDNQAAVIGSRPAPRLKLISGAFDQHGKSAAVREDTAAWPPSATAAPEVRLELLSDLALKPGRYDVRVAADAGSGRQGSVYTTVDVPDFSVAPVSLSGVVLSVAPGPPAKLRELLPLLPTVRRTFAPTESVTAFARVYQGGNGALVPVTVTERIVDSANHLVVDRRTPLGVDAFGAARAADEHFDVPVGRLAPGEYMLRLEAGAGDRAAWRDVVFSVKSALALR